ncbi:MAG: hypothetical protein AAF514_07840, partial [Verrucomicrobiota bacterium]
MQPPLSDSLWEEGELFKRPLRHRGFWRRPGVLRELTRIAEKAPTFGNRIKVYHEGDDLYDSQLEAIAGARKRVIFEVYMFLSDLTSWKFAYALGKKAAEGIEVFLLYDAIGSWQADSRIHGYLRKHGVKVLEYRPVAPWRKRFGFFGRNHCKILVVDEEV